MEMVVFLKGNNYDHHVQCYEINQKQCYGTPKEEDISFTDALSENYAVMVMP